ncbi:MAG: outer membrane beta-barrel family protein [Bacteroidales bacterium]
MIVVIIIFGATTVYGNPDLESKGHGIIRGKVVESTSGEAVEYATVALYTAGDSLLIDGQITDHNGEFVFKKVETGNYKVIISFMGFRKILVDGIAITDQSTEADLGTLTMRPAAMELGEVEISAERPLVEYKIDRKVVNVEQQIQAQGGSAVDVLERIPSIRTDLEGNVELRGSSSFQVLIDGKPSILSGSDALNQIPAASIDKIEIITNPSAKYDPDGTAGIINIITKKNALKGLSGILNLSADNSPGYSANLMLNYRTRKTSISFGADYSDREGPGNRYSLRESWKGDTVSYLKTNGDMNWGRESITLKGGIDHNISELNTFTAEASYRYHGRTRDNNTRNSSWDNFNPEQVNYLTDAYDESTTPAMQFSLGDVQKFNREGSELSMRLTYNTGEDSEEESTLQYYTDESWTEQGATVLDYRTSTTAQQHELRGDLDFQYTFDDKSILESGFQLRSHRNEEDYNWFNRDSLGMWIPDTIQSNLYDFNHDIFALYGTYAAEYGNLGLKAGLRAEYTDRNLIQITDGGDYPYKSFDLYPSAYLTYYLPYNQQVQASYSKRVNRPRGHMLNPYPLFSDAFISFSGNPYLEPEFAHSAELNYQKIFGYSSLSIESYYRYVNNKMTRTLNLNDDGVLEMTMENLDHDRSFGIEANANIKLNSWLTVNPVATIYDYKLTETSGEEKITKQSTNWDASIEFAANLPSGTKLRLNGNYYSPSVTLDGTREGTYYMGFAARQDFFDNNLSLTFTVRDILDSRHRKGTTEGDNYTNYYEMWRKAPVFSLSLSYKWNNYRRQRNSNGFEGGDFDVIDMGGF